MQRAVTLGTTCGSSGVRPMTDGISGASLDRPASVVQSLTSRATPASSGCVQAGWSDHGSPARYDANSMKQAPLRGLRCLPRDNTGTARSDLSIVAPGDLPLSPECAGSCSGATGYPISLVSSGTGLPA